MKTKSNENCFLKFLILTTLIYLNKLKILLFQYLFYEIINSNFLKIFCLHFIIKLKRFLYFLLIIFDLFFALMLNFLKFSIILFNFQNIRSFAKKQNFIYFQYIFTAKIFLSNSNLKNIITKKFNIIIKIYDLLFHYIIKKHILSNLFNAIQKIFIIEKNSFQKNFITKKNDLFKFQLFAEIHNSFINRHNVFVMYN